MKYIFVHGTYSIATGMMEELQLQAVPPIISKINTANLPNKWQVNKSHIFGGNQPLQKCLRGIKPLAVKTAVALEQFLGF